MFEKPKYPPVVDPERGKVDLNKGGGEAHEIRNFLSDNIVYNNFSVSSIE